jgi:hypothetical protein
MNNEQPANPVTHAKATKRMAGATANAEPRANYLDRLQRREHGYTPRGVSAAFPDSLCHRCSYLRLVTSGKGSTFLMCQNPALPKYPPQPVRQCSGFSPTLR